MLIEVIRNGKILKINQKVADVLIKKGIVTRHVPSDASDELLPEPVVAEIDPPEDVVDPGAVMDLGEMNAAQLHALAKERGIEVHHRAGADKVRAALREAAQ